MLLPVFFELFGGSNGGHLKIQGSLEVTDSFLTFGFYRFPALLSKRAATMRKRARAQKVLNVGIHLADSTVEQPNLGVPLGLEIYIIMGFYWIMYIYIYTCICNPTSWDTPLQQWLFSYLQITY